MTTTEAVLQSLLHDSLLATGHVESCALFRKKDGSVKAASAGYEVISGYGLRDGHAHDAFRLLKACACTFKL